MQCSQGWTTKNRCHVFLHPLCAELSQRKKKVDGVGIVSYKCGVHSFGKGSACRICKSVFRQREMIDCVICSDRFHANCVDLQLKTMSPDEEWLCKSCINEGLAKGTIVEKSVDGKRSTRRQGIKTYVRVNQSLSVSPSRVNKGDVLTAFTNKRKPNTKRSATMIEDGAEMFFTKVKSVRSKPAADAVHKTVDGVLSGSEGESDILQPDGEATAHTRSKKNKVAEDLLGRWPNPQECVENVITNPLRHASEIAKIELKHKTQFKEWAFLLQTNHSLLFYGFGSKRKLLDDFANEELSKGGYVANIQGYR